MGNLTNGFIFIQSYTLTQKGELKKLKEIKTPLSYIDMVENFKKNTYWINVENLWVLVGKIPPLEPKKDDILIFREKNSLGMFKFIGEDDKYVYIQDLEGRRKSKALKEYLENIEIYGKILRVQNKI